LKKLLRDILRSSFLQRAVGVLAAEYLRLVWKTNRFSREPQNIYDLVEPSMPAILVFWHGQRLPSSGSASARFAAPAIMVRPFTAKAVSARSRRWCARSTRAIMLR
jgi:hypothetical protein